MRTRYFILLFVSIFLMLNANNYRVYGSLDNYYISFDEDKNEYNLYYESGGYLNDSIKHFSPVTYELYSSGDYCMQNKRIVCTDTISKHRLVFEKVDDYTIKVVDADNLLEKSKVLWLAISRTDTLEVFMKWKDGRKNGNWLYYFSNGSCSLIQYENNLMKDSIRFESTDKMKMYMFDNRHNTSITNQ